MREWSQASGWGNCFIVRGVAIGLGVGWLFHCEGGGCGPQGGVVVSLQGGGGGSGPWGGVVVFSKGVVAVPGLGVGWFHNLPGTDPHKFAHEAGREICMKMVPPPMG